MSEGNLLHDKLTMLLSCEADTMSTQISSRGRDGADRSGGGLTCLRVSVPDFHSFLTIISPWLQLVYRSQ